MCLKPNYLKGMPIPCGKCIECRIDYSRQWAYRIMLESLYHKDNCFITLTYDDNNLPEGKTLRKKDLQKFMKRLRKHFPSSAIRFFACGEYGSKNNRPHYHVILFGTSLSDRYYFFTDKKGNKMYRSPLLEKCWKLGISSVGDLTFDTALYTAKYMQKVKFLKDDTRQKPFLLMSRKPGIGYQHYGKIDFINDKIYYNGKYIKIPRYYTNRLKDEFPEFYENFKHKRVIKAYGESYSFIESLEYAPMLDSKAKDYEIFLDNKRKKYKRIFGKSLDKDFRLIYNE